MTKAPFASVAWLSQSSRAPKKAREELPEAQRGEPYAKGGSTWREGPPVSRGSPPQQQQVHPSPPKASLGPSAPSSSALASPEGEWVSSGGSSDGEGSLSEGGPPTGKSPQSSSSSSSSISPRRRLRTAFSLEQISTLESAFQRHRYLGAAQRRKLAAKMQLSEVQIKTWFQNRRMKLKRQMQEMRPEVYSSIPFYSPLPFAPSSGPLSYVYSPHHQTVSKREDPMPLGLPFPSLPAPSIDPRSPSAGQPGALWPMPLPCLVGYQDPRTVFMTL
ncbi:homeobox protein vent1-like [Anolis sagrei]|uniref:homeobox protein vent1-like n=1 Tax=Anolis sagrei TaxID=38937 RepID=UPI0035225299